MSAPAPAPLLRPPGNSPRPNRTPRLGLSIPPSAHAPQPVIGANPRGPPKLKLATPGNMNGAMGPPEHTRKGSLSNQPTSAASQYPALSFTMGLKNQVKNSPDAVQINGNRSNDEPSGKTFSEQEFDTMDVEELPVDGWMRVQKTGRIVELGSLGEGAGGAVTRCILKGGKTVFALKVSRLRGGHSIDQWCCSAPLNISRSSPPILPTKSGSRSREN